MFDSKGYRLRRRNINVDNFVKDAINLDIRDEDAFASMCFILPDKMSGKSHQYKGNILIWKEVYIDSDPEYAIMVRISHYCGDPIVSTPIEYVPINDENELKSTVIRLYKEWCNSSRIDYFIKHPIDANADGDTGTIEVYQKIDADYRASISK